MYNIYTLYSKIVIILVVILVVNERLKIFGSRLFVMSWRSTHVGTTDQTSRAKEFARKMFTRMHVCNYNIQLQAEEFEFSEF